MLLTTPKDLQEISQNLLGLIPQDCQFDLIGGIELEGVVLATMISKALHKDFIIIRNNVKEYGTKKVIEGCFDPRSTVLLVEDTLKSNIQEIMTQLESLDLLIVGILARQNPQNIPLPGIPLYLQN